MSECPTFALNSTITKQLAIEITKDKFLTPKEDPIQPIVDIIHGSIMKYDLATTRVGLKAVTDQVIKIIDSIGEKEISERFCGHLRRIGRLAISREDVESTVEAIENLVNFAKSTAEKGLEDATKQVAWSLGEVGRTAVEKGLEDAAWEGVEFLGDVGEVAAEKGLEGATKKAAWSLLAIGEAAAEKGLEDATQKAAWSLLAIGETAAREGLEDATRVAAQSLAAVGETTAKKGLDSATREAARSLAELTILSGEIIKTAIRNHELVLELGEQDRGSFQKFMRIYEQELEKLRAKRRTPNKKTESS